MRPIPARFIPLALAIGLLASACSAPVRTASAKDLSVLREYTLSTTVPDPQAQWNPETYQIVARSLKGVAILDEGTGNQNFLASQDFRESCHPWWVSRTQFVFGPPTLMVTTAEGKAVPNSQGLTVVTLGGGTHTITRRGYRPRVWNDHIVAQDEERVMLVDQQGVISEFAPGFFAEPQRHGGGICLLDRPVTEPDLWSGNPVRRGKLVIHWPDRTISQIPDVIEPRWTADGGVLATRLRAEPETGKPWWQGGTDVVYIAGPKAAPVVVATDARSAAPHPTLPIFAAVENLRNDKGILLLGALLLGDLDGRTRLRKADLGDHPQWSHDGVRLMAEEPIPGKPELCALHVYVFKITARN